MDSCCSRARIASWQIWHCLCACSFNSAKWSSAARSRAGKSAAFLQAKTLSCSSRDAGCTRGRLLVLKLVGGWCLPPRRFNIADCPPSLCVAEALAEWLLAGRGAACWGVARAGARGGRQGGRRGGRMLRKTRQTRPLQSMRRSLIHSKWLENGTFIRSQLTPPQTDTCLSGVAPTWPFAPIYCQI